MYLDATPSLDGAAPALAAALTPLAALLADRSATPSAPSAADDLVLVLERLRQLVPGTQAASVVATNPALRATEVADLTTVAATSDLARAADQCQLARAAGPTMEGRERLVQVGADALRHRWPDVAERLAALGVTAVLALPLPGLPGRGALTLYADAPFPAGAPAAAAEAAAGAALALAGLELRDRAANLEVALASSRQIAAAVGIVMAHDRCSYDDAFHRIRSISQRTHRKMRELADQIVFTGALPAEGA